MAPKKTQPNNDNKMSKNLPKKNSVNKTDI